MNVFLQEFLSALIEQAAQGRLTPERVDAAVEEGMRGIAAAVRPA